MMPASAFFLPGETMFIDEATLHVRGGKGGDGCVAFRREKYVPRGGPDGGDGGDGGSVSLRANVNLMTLLDFHSKPLFAAENGERGRGKNQTGRSGVDMVLDVPPGTIVRDAATGLVLRDLVAPGDTVEVARGGKGGYGNKHFASPVNRLWIVPVLNPLFFSASTYTSMSSTLTSQGGFRVYPRKSFQALCASFPTFGEKRVFRSSSHASNASPQRLIRSPIASPPPASSP